MHYNQVPYGQSGEVPVNERVKYIHGPLLELVPSLKSVHFNILVPCEFIGTIFATLIL